MLFLILVLAAAGVYVEMKAIKSVPWFGRFLARYRLASLGFSLGLSVLLGSFFGAAGLIVFGAGIVSTVMIQPYYAMMKNGQLEMVRQKKSEARRFYAEKKDVYARRAHQVFGIVKFVVRILVIPFIIFFKVLDFFDWLFGGRKEVTEVA